MRLLPFLFIVLLPVSASAQIGHDLTLFDEDGDRFILTLNGQVMNDSAMSRITLTDLLESGSLLDIRYPDQPGFHVQKTRFHFAGSSPYPVIVTYSIRTRKGQKRLRYRSRLFKIVPGAPIIIQKEPN